MVEPSQRVHFRGIKDDAVKMWGVLEGVHMQKQPGTQFNAYDDLFSIRKHDVDDAVHRIHDLWSIGFTLDKLDNELASMTLIIVLPENYNSFVSSLLIRLRVKHSVCSCAATSSQMLTRMLENA